MASLDFLHNNPVFEQNTRLSRMFSDQYENQYTSFDRFFGQVGNDPFAQVQGLEFDTARFRSENSFQELQNKFEIIHNNTLNIETETTPVMVAYEEAPSIVFDNISYEDPISSFISEPLHDSKSIDIADYLSFFDAASGQVLSFKDDNFGEIVGAMLEKSDFVISQAPEVIAEIDNFGDAFDTMSKADIFEIQVTPEDMAQDYFDLVEDYADPVATIDVPVDAPQEMALIDLGQNMPEFAQMLASDDLFTIKSEAIYEIAMPQGMDYDYDYKQIVMDNLLQDMNVGSWENMVLHKLADLDYALANNDPLNNVLSEDIILNDDGYSGLHSDLQNLTSY